MVDDEMLDVYGSAYDRTQTFERFELFLFDPDAFLFLVSGKGRLKKRKQERDER